MTPPSLGISDSLNLIPCTRWRKRPIQERHPDATGQSGRAAPDQIAHRRRMASVPCRYCTSEHTRSSIARGSSGVSGRVYPGNRPISTRAHSLSAWNLGASVEPGACPCSAASARPGAACATIAGRPVPCGGLCASRGAPTGGVRPPQTRPYAVPRRTRRRGDAGRGAAGPAVWGRRPAGPACACCARYATSWSPASSSSCS